MLIVLNSVGKSIVAYLSSAVAANQPDFTSHYADSTATAFTEGGADGVLSSTTPVTLVSAPAASTTRIIKDISVYNADTASVELILALVNGASTRIIAKKTLTSGETFVLSALGMAYVGLEAGNELQINDDYRFKLMETGWLELQRETSPGVWAKCGSWYKA